MALLLKQGKAAKVRNHYGQEENGVLIPEILAWKEDSLWVARFEVTNAQFAAFNPKHRFAAAEANYPVAIDFSSAKAYLSWLNQKTGETYRLPTLEESEAWHKKAHKAGAKENTLNYWAGYALTANEVANFRKKLSEAAQSLLKPVGQFAPTKLGKAEIYDLAGNVAEYNATGGTYGYSAYDYVDPNDPAVKPVRIGFRVVKEK